MKDSNEVRHIYNMTFCNSQIVPLDFNAGNVACSSDNAPTRIQEGEQGNSESDRILERDELRFEQF